VGAVAGSRQVPWRDPKVGEHDTSIMLYHALKDSMKKSTSFKSSNDFEGILS
jgi:hypothetical protein